MLAEPYEHFSSRFRHRHSTTRHAGLRRDGEPTVRARRVRRGGRRVRRRRGASLRVPLLSSDSAPRRFRGRSSPRTASHPRLRVGRRGAHEERGPDAVRRVRRLPSQLLPQHAALARRDRRHRRGALAHRARASPPSRPTRRRAILRSRGGRGRPQGQDRALPRRERHHRRQSRVRRPLRQARRRRRRPLQHLRHPRRSRARRLPQGG